MNDKFKQCIQDSERILITAHTSPDPDAVSSVLLLGTTLRSNFPNKKIEMVLEEKPNGLDFLKDYGQIEFSSLAKAMTEFRPDLFVMLDANSYSRCSRHDGQQIKDYVSENDVKTAVIDHHEPDGKDETDVYINSGNPACVQEVYELCFEQMDLKKPEGYAETTMLGLYADTGGFVYENPRYKETHRVAVQLIDAGASVEAIAHRLSAYTEDSLKVLAELINNISHEGNCTFSFVSDEFTANWQKQNKPVEAFKEGFDIYQHHFMRNIDGRPWGFGVCQDLSETDKTYRVSFRSLRGIVDVAAIARKLGGGGHKPAAGAVIKAPNVAAAIEQVRQAIATA